MNAPELCSGKWHVRDDVAAVEMDRSVFALALSSRNPVPHALEGSATTIWRSIDGERDAEQIAARIVREYGADFAVVFPQVCVFLVELEQVGLIERSHPEGGEQP